MHILPICNQANPVPTGKINKDGNAIKKSTLTRDYNLHMGSVDRVDQQLHSINTLHKSYKWYKKLAFKKIMQMVLNVQKICVSTTGTNITLVSFIKKVTTSRVTIHEDLPINMLMKLLCV